MTEATPLSDLNVGVNAALTTGIHRVRPGLMRLFVVLQVEDGRLVFEFFFVSMMKLEAHDGRTIWQRFSGEITKSLPSLLSQVNYD